MSEYAEIAHLSGQLKHAKRSADVTVDSLIESSVEVDASGAVDDHMAIFKQILEYFRLESKSLFLQIALAE